MPAVLIIYSSHDGHTAKICQVLQHEIQYAGQAATVVAIENADQISPSEFDQIIIGASIKYGKHSPEIVAYIEKHQALLDSKPNAFFSVNVVARKPEKNSPETNPYLQKFLRCTAWKPKQLAVFAGKIDYPSYSSFDRFMIRLIMWMTRGPTDPQATIEFTDWNQVKAFARLIVKAGQDN